MQLKSSIIAAIVVLSFAPTQALAESPTYNYAVISYADYDFGLDGFALDGSYAFNESFHVIAGYARVTGGGATLNGAMAAIGWHHPFAANTDFVARGGLVRFQGDIDVFVEAGVRSMVTADLELNAFLVYSGSGGDTSLDNAFRTADPGIRIGGVYNFNRTSGVTFGFDDDSSWTIGYRYSF